MSEKRAYIDPDRPTFKEQGYDIIMSSLRGMGAPKGLPEDVRQKLVSAVQKAANDPDFREQAKKMFVPLRYLGPDQYKAEMEANEAMFKEVRSEERRVGNGCVSTCSTRCSPYP